jgi:hypothetical protein
MILLRSMFEHSATFLYFRSGLSGQLDMKNDDIERFVDYGHVHTYKTFQNLKEVYEGELDPEEFEHVDANFKNVKDKFQIEKCSKCGTTRTAFSWSKLDIVSMALRAGIPKEVTFFCYREALAYAHPSITYIEKRIQIDDEGKWDYQFTSERDEQKILTNSHLLALMACEAMLLYSGDDNAEKMIAPHAEKWKVCWDSIANL